VLLERRRDAWKIAAVAVGSLLLSLLVVGAGSRPRHPGSGPRHFLGHGSLPLSGDYADEGIAFRDGFREGLGSAPDSLFDWKWNWTDNQGDPDLARQFVASTGKPASDLELVGLSSIATDLPPCREVCLVLDDGGPHRPDPLRWDLWTPAPIQRGRILALLRGAAPPRMVVVAAAGPWTEPVLPGLVDSLAGLQVILHDPGNSKWDDAVAQILEIRPRSILFWDAPADASSLLSRRLAWSVFLSAHLWVPEGTAIPTGFRVDTLRPVWQAAPGSGGDSWNRWGRLCGRALANSTRDMLKDSTSNWMRALSRSAPDSGLDTSSTGWYPGRI